MLCIWLWFPWRKKLIKVSPRPICWPYPLELLFQLMGRPRWMHGRWFSSSVQLHVRLPNWFSYKFHEHQKGLSWIPSHLCCSLLPCFSQHPLGLSRIPISDNQGLFLWFGLHDISACALALNLAVFLLIGKTSALTMNVAGLVKDWLLIT